MRHEEERHNFTTRATAHQELTRAPSPAGRGAPAPAPAPASAPRGTAAPGRATPEPVGASRGAAAPSRATPGAASGAGSSTNHPATGR
jgi:hypothetical protein